jgi:hypothetical protein
MELGPQAYVEVYHNTFSVTTTIKLPVLYFR